MTARTEAEVRGETLARVGLLLTGVMCWWGATTAFEGGNPAQYGWVHLLVLVGFVWGFVLLGASALPRPPRWATGLVVAGAALILLDHAAVNAEVSRFVGTPATTDVRVYMDYAAWLLLQGDNPYTHDLTAAYGPHRATLQYATPLVDGGLTGRLAYPALSFLAHVPTLVLGISDKWVYLVCMLLSLGGLLRWARPELRPVVLLPFLVEPRFVGYAFSGVSDGLWAMLLVGMAAMWDRRVARAVLLGLACSAKQHPWILAPFLAMRVYSETEGDTRAKLLAVGELVAISVATFLLVNLPFVIWSPSAWYAGVFEPLSAPMITWGTGLSSLSAWGTFAAPRWVWSLTFYGGLLAGLWALYRHPRRLGPAVWLLPGIALFMGHRSLTSYWYYGLLPLVMELSVGRAPPLVRERPAMGTLAAVGAFAGLLAGVLGSFAAQPDPLMLRVGRPMWVEGHRVNQMIVGVQNTSDQVVRPRFQIQTAAEQPLFWDIRSGPETLRPGEDASYLIGTRVPFESFEMARGAVLFVGDAGGYWPRGSVHIEPDVDFARPDRIPNPSFAYWADGGARPQFWQVRSEGPSEAEWGQRGGVSLRLRPSLGAKISVSTSLLLPAEAVSLQVRVPEGANRPPELMERYGLRLSTGDSSGVLLYGDDDGSGTFEDGTPWVMRPAPREAWSSQTLQLDALLDELGLSAEHERHRLPRFGHLDFPMVPIEIELFYEAREEGADRTAWFGGFGQSDSALARTHYSNLHPEDLELWLTEREIQAGNAGRSQQLERAVYGALLVNLAEDAAQTGSRLEAQALMRRAEQEPLREEDVERLRLVYEVLGLLEDWEVSAMELADRAVERGELDQARILWSGLAEHQAAQGACESGLRTLARARRLGAVEPEPGGALALCTPL